VFPAAVLPRWPASGRPSSTRRWRSTTPFQGRQTWLRDGRVSSPAPVRVAAPHLRPGYAADRFRPVALRLSLPSSWAPSAGRRPIPGSYNDGKQAAPGAVGGKAAATRFTTTKPTAKCRRPTTKKPISFLLTSLRTPPGDYPPRRRHLGRRLPLPAGDAAHQESPILTNSRPPRPTHGAPTAIHPHAPTIAVGFTVQVFGS